MGSRPCAQKHHDRVLASCQPPRRVTDSSRIHVTDSLYGPPRSAPWLGSPHAHTGTEISGRVGSYIACSVSTKVSSFRFHDLRHTAATYLQAATGDLLITQQVLGHADVRMTTKYAHVSDERLRQAISGLQVALSG